MTDSIDATAPDCECGCPTQAFHDEGQRLQVEMRAKLKVPDDQCVGCYLGDDGPSMHDFGYACELYVG
jgi:hypothetical protein